MTAYPYASTYSFSKQVAAHPLRIRPNHTLKRHAQFAVISPFIPLLSGVAEGFAPLSAGIHGAADLSYGVISIGE
ncbi:hypothetical protein OCU04_004559 [Sclerotinia nivalis]|uniref:Uncharacterized protein n=1 Tax=Sclerotinia nivalis TaxID=352851 RepID=A0A9X0ARH0_9HELO|nr:hypothetical protein OCU04_004559 [Sclerotinia nivalis]